MDNIRLLWDSNFILPQFLSFLDGYLLVLFIMPSLLETWWNMGELPAEKGSDDQVCKSSQS